MILILEGVFLVQQVFHYAGKYITEVQYLFQAKDDCLIKILWKYWFETFQKTVRTPEKSWKGRLKVVTDVVLQDNGNRLQRSTIKMLRWLVQ